MKFYLKSASVINSLLHQFAAEIPSLTDVDKKKNFLKLLPLAAKGLCLKLGARGVSAEHTKKIQVFTKQRTMHFSVVSHSLFKVKVPETGLCI